MFPASCPSVDRSWMHILHPHGIEGQTGKVKRVPESCPAWEPQMCACGSAAFAVLFPSLPGTLTEGASSS